jgi:zinc transport system substrate-binding protein
MRFVTAMASLCLLAGIISSAGVRADADIRVVVSIKPLHALVLGVMQGVASPELLLESSQSPHHASLRPSDMRSLAKADLLVWAGPQLETFLPRVIRGLDERTRVLTLMENPHLELLPQRSHHSHSGEATEHSTDNVLSDPHIWLSTRNVDLIVEQLAQALIQLDPSHTAEYTRNSKRMHQQIQKLREQISSRLKVSKKHISYHDAYQYFENEFGLHNAGIVAPGDELQPSAHHIRELRKLIEQQDITCVVYDAPRRPAVISTLLSGSRAHAVELDALGLRQHDGSQAWFELMRALADNFSSCLSG